MKTLKEHYKYREITKYASDVLGGYFDYDKQVDGAELHHEIYNSDYFVVGASRAKDWLKDADVFEIINEVITYEKDNFGEVMTNIASPKKVVNMYVYIVGELVLQESKTLQNAWDRVIEKNELKAISDELKAILG